MIIRKEICYNQKKIRERIIGGDRIEKYESADCKLGLKSSKDRMSWDVFINSGYMKDKTIAW